jgi:MraZ protein
MLRGNAPAKIDAKGRLKIPSAFRGHILDSWGSDFYVTSITGQSARVYPLLVWQEIEERLAQIPSFNPAKKKFLDRTNFYGQETAMDKQGRIALPTELQKSAEMVGEVAVLGYLNYLEVCNKERVRARLGELTEQDEMEISTELGV